MVCKICDSTAVFFETATVLGKYPAAFYRCSKCGLVQAEKPFWLSEAYRDPITSSDIGYVSRNVHTSKAAKACISILFDRAGKFVDYGGGYGLFVRLMRDKGFDFFLYDPYCQNLFAKGFDAGRGQRYELLTSFEVFEHVENPREVLQEMLAFSDNILFSTVLLPNPPPRLQEWWYYGLHHGQHVSFYTVEALRELAKQAGLHLVSDGGGFHLFTRSPVPAWRFHLLFRHAVVSLFDIVVRYPSKLAADYDLISKGATQSPVEKKSDNEPDRPSP